MNSNTLNVVYSFNSNAAIKCEYKRNTLNGKADRATLSPSSLPSYECFLKYKINNDSRNIYCFHEPNRYNSSVVEDMQEEYDRAATTASINTKRLGLSWRKQINVLQHQLVPKNETKLLSCLTNDTHQFNTLRRIPIAYDHEYLNYSYLQSIISEKKLSLHHINNVTTNSQKNPVFEWENSENIIDESISANYINCGKKFLCAKTQKCYHHKHRTRRYSSILNYVRLILSSCSYPQKQNYKFLYIFLVLLLTLAQYLAPIQGMLVSKSSQTIGIDLGSFDFENTSDLLLYNSTSNISNNSSIKNGSIKTFHLEHETVDKGRSNMPSSKSLTITSPTEGGTSGGAYLDKLDNLERSLAAVLIKVAYGTTSTTKRSIPENSYVPSLTTIATPLLTTLRYFFLLTKSYI